MDGWYGKRRPLPHPVKVEIDAFDGTVSAETLLRSGEHHSPAQLADLSIFIYRFLQPDMDVLPNEWLSALKALSTDANPDLKAAALAALHLSQGNKPMMRSFLKQQLNSLGTDEAAIRRRWAYDLNDVGDTYKMRGDVKNARRSYEKVLEIDPKQARILTNLGTIDGEVGRYDEAIEKFRQAIAVNPEYAAAYFNLGIALSHQGHDKAAREAFHQAELRRKDMVPSRSGE